MRFLSTLVASTLGVFVAFGLLFFFFMLFLFAVAAASDETPQVRSGTVLALEISGAIPEIVSGDPLAQAFGGEAAYDLRDLQRALRRAAADDRIEALWIQMNTAGGSWASLHALREALVAFKASGKPVYASSEDTYTDEAAYFLSSVADSIFAGPEAFFEFNGFVQIGEFYANALDKLDVEPQIVRAGTFKSAVEPYTRTDFSPESEEQLASLLDTWNEVFNDAIAESRGLTDTEVQTLAATDAIVTTQDALRAGLIDGIRYRDEVVDLLKARLGVEADDELRTIAMKRYVKVPDRDAGLETDGDGEIAIVYANGIIMDGESGYNANPLLGGEMVGSETFAEAMRRVREREAVDAVVVRVNSPGGSAPAADVMRRAIELTAREKPVIISMGNVAASGGYWLATAGDEILADPLTITGSIGVFSLLFDVSGLFENKLGITYDFVQTSPYADMLTGLTALSDAERQLMQRSVEETYRSFLEKVAQSQEMTVEQVDAIAQGRVWTGSQALEVGLVDALGSLDDALARAAERAGLEDGFRTSIYPKPKTFLEELSDQLSARSARAWARLGASPSERLLLDELDHVRAFARQHGGLQARLPAPITVR